VSNSRVFYTGDGSTARFNIADLTGGTALGVVRDSMVSNLATGQVYLLANGGTPLTSSGGTATAPLEIDGNTGVPTGGSIALSSAISLPSGPTGIFAGWGRIVLHDGTTAYNIDLPSGTVTNLGAMATCPHFGCESWAYWGVAEQLGSDLWIAYVEDSQTIVRRRVTDGLRKVVGTFTSLSDMCSFTIAPSRNRWYFHYEGSAQFGGSAETVGFADATSASSFPDGDSDGIPEFIDNCSALANAPQDDADGDGFGDSCDPCFGSGPTDVDVDLICDGEDNCPTVVNPLQEDGNGDDIGDACSPQVVIGSIVPSHSRRRLRPGRAA
jgi:hypothetical protein